MTDQPLPPAVTVTDMLLTAIHGELRDIRALLAPAAATEPEDGETVELREPAAPKPEKAPEKARRRR